MFATSAEAKTSAGAPSITCLASSDEAAKLKVTDVSGYSSVNAAPSSVNASARDAAANTATSPDTPAVVGPSALVDASPPQPPTTVSMDATATTRSERARTTGRH